MLIENLPQSNYSKLLNDAMLGGVIDMLSDRFVVRFDSIRFRPK